MALHIPATVGDNYNMEKDFVKFRLRERKDGVQAIFLSFYYQGKRHEESLRLYIVPENTREDKKKNKETWAIAETVRARRLVELKENIFKLKTDAPKVYLLEMWQTKIEQAESNGNRGQWSSSYKKMFEYLKGKDILLTSITTQFCEDYKAYLMKEATCESFKIETRKLKGNSQCAYFSKFKVLLKDAARRKYIEEDPSEFVHSPKLVEAERAYLTIEELHAMTEAPCLTESVRICFMFSCLTGLRRSDVLKLKWGEVSNMEGFTRLTFHQQKTSGLQYLDINEQAAELMGERKGAEEYVFPRLPEPDTTNHVIRTWAAAAGVNKHLTFHSGRHTFATLMLSLGTDLYTVSKLLGHRNINTTQIYAKVLDKNKQNAVKKIPKLNL